MMKKSLVLSLVVLIGAHIFCANEVVAQDTSSYSSNQHIMLESGKTARTEIKEWRYKIVNGVLYKRLFNATTGQWIGDWIRCA